MDFHVNSETRRDLEAAPGSAEALPAEASIESDRTPRDWSVWLLVPAAILLFVALVSLYYLPTDISLILLARVCLGLALASFVVIAWRTIHILRSPSNNVVSYSRDGTPVVRNRLLPLYACLMGCIAFSIFPALSLFLSFNGGSFYNIQEVILYPFGLICNALVLTIVLCLLWLGRIQPFRPLRRLLQSRLATPVIIIIAVIFYGAVSYFSSQLYDSAYAFTGPYASWSQDVQFVRHTADFIDSSAVVDHVSAEPDYYHAPSQDPKDAALDVNFAFLRSGGRTFSIEFLDTDPPRIISIDNPSYYVSSTPPGNTTELANNFSYDKLGPRDVYNIVDQTDAGVRSILYLNNDNWSTLYGSPAGWVTDYMVNTPGSNGSQWQDVVLAIDGASGKIVRRESRPEGGTTPTPQPSDTFP